MRPGPSGEGVNRAAHVADTGGSCESQRADGRASSSASLRGAAGQALR